MDALAEIEQWKKAGEELRASLLQRRAAALVELALVDAALTRLGKPSVALQSRRGAPFKGGGVKSEDQENARHVGEVMERATRLGPKRAASRNKRQKVVDR